MKRSEAIKIIQSVLNQPYDNPAVTILMKLEEAGILPPEIEASWSFVSDDFTNDTEHRWEEE